MYEKCVGCYYEKECSNEEKEDSEKQGINCFYNDED